MASGTIKTLKFKSVDFTLPEATIAANGYKEWTGIDISQSGWIPLCLTVSCIVPVAIPFRRMADC